MTNTKLIFSDVDGTLIESERGFTKNMKNAVKHLNNKNIEFVMCSGRPTANLINEANELNEFGCNVNYVSGFNGAELYDLKNEKLIYSYGLDLTDVKSIVSNLSNLNLDYITYEEDIIKTSDISSKLAKHEANINKLELRKLEELHPSTKVLGLSPADEVLENVSSLQEALPNFTIINSTPFFIEITKKGVDKGFGLEKTAQFLNVDIKDIICFGDAGNDISMFKHNCKKIAVDNAIPSIKDLADNVIGHVEDDAVANYILQNL